MLEQMRAEDRQRRDAARAGGGAVPMPDQADEGYWSYMQRQVQERTERLDIMGNSMDRLEETSAGWAEDVSKFVSQQKKKAVMGSEFVQVLAARQARANEHHSDWQQVRILAPVRTRAPQKRLPLAVVSQTFGLSHAESCQSLSLLVCLGHSSNLQ